MVLVVMWSEKNFWTDLAESLKNPADLIKISYIGLLLF